MTRDTPLRESLYAEVTQRVIAELEACRLPWVQPWDTAACGCGMPENALTGRRYSGINVLILWASACEHGYPSQRWLTFRQALSAGGNVRRGEKATTICFADRFTPKGEAARAADEHREARVVPFLKRFAVFNVVQCDGLEEMQAGPGRPLSDDQIAPRAHALIDATRADFRIGGGEAFYAPGPDFIAVPPQRAFLEPIDWYRTAFHELGHWTGHPSRLDRDQSAGWGTAGYAHEELVAEMAAAFTCASLSIQPKARHSDYVGAWLSVLRDDERAIFRAASYASRATDYLLAFEQAGAEP
jgi:antirestriction protein ArdC